MFSENSSAHSYDIISGHIKLEKSVHVLQLALGFFAQAEKYRNDKHFFQTSFNIKKWEIYLVSFYAQIICSLIAAHSLPWTLMEYQTGSYFSVPNRRFFPQFPGTNELPLLALFKSDQWSNGKTIKPLFSSFQSPKTLRVWYREMQCIKRQKRLEKALGGIAVYLHVMVLNEVIEKEAKQRILL